MSKNKASPAGRVKISVKNVKLSAMESGFAFSGKYVGRSVGQPFQTVTSKGEVITKSLTSVIMEGAEGERTAYLADQGLLGALNDALVTEGQLIEVVKLEKINLTKGRTMNQYDIFALDARGA